MMRQLFSRLAALVRREDADARLDVEVEAHLALLAAEHERQGMRPGDARLAARRAFGAVADMKEQHRDQRRARWWSDVRADLRYAVRTLRRTPVFAGVAILTLALGIGANTAIFSLVDSLYLRALPVSAPARLVQVRTFAHEYAVFEKLQNRPGIFQSIGSYAQTQFNLGTGAGAEWVDGMWASGRLLETLGVRVVAGRPLTAADDRRGGGPDGPAALISHRLWQRRFGGAASAIGQTLFIQRVPVTVVGVVPPEFFGLVVGRTFDVMVSTGAYPLIVSHEWLNEGATLDYVARLPPGVGLDTATARLRAVQPQIREELIHDDPARDADGFLEDPFALSPFGQAEAGKGYGRPLALLSIVVGLVLLIACANIANLLLARATARRQELSVRRALGATRWRLVRQMLIESLTIAACGAGAGLLLAMWASAVLVREFGAEAALTMGRIQFGAARFSLDLSLDWRVLAFTGAAAVTTAVIFGLMPALRGSAVAPMDALKEQGQTPDRARSGYASVLIAGQVAISLVLVVAAGLLIRTFTALADFELGFEPDRVLVVDAETPPELQPDDRMAKYRQALDALRRLPGVEAAALSVQTPVSTEGFGIGVATDQGSDTVGARIVGDAYFRTAGISILAGREFTERDRLGTPPVAIVSRAFARQVFGGASPIGRSVSFGQEAGVPIRIEIVGLAEDVVTSPRRGANAMIYVALAQLPPAHDFLTLAFEEGGLSLNIRSAAGAPLVLRRSVGQLLETAHPELSLTYRSMREELDALLTLERVLAQLSGFFGLLALLLAAVGLHGVTAYAVGRRTAEIGIRLALGASPRRVIATVLSGVGLVVGVGVLVGLVASRWLSNLMVALLHGVEPGDPLTLAGAVLTLVAAAALAAAVPAVRASRIDPARVLRRSN